MSDLLNIIWTIPIKNVPLTGGEIQNKYYFEALNNNRNVDVRYVINQNWHKVIGLCLRNRNIIISDSYYRNKFIIINNILRIITKAKIIGFVWRPYHKPLEKSLLGKLSYIAFWLYLKPCHAVFVNSQATAAWVDNIVKKKKTVICLPSPNIIGHQPKRITNYVIKLLMVGYFMPVKGHKYIVEALQNISSDKWQLTLIGGIKDQKCYDVVMDMINNCKISQNITIVNNADAVKIKEAYELADIYIQPSLEEGYGMAICEAMTFGLPIIGSKTGGIPELVEDGVNGWLVEPGSSEDILDKLNLLICDRNLRTKMGNNSREMSRKFMTWQENTDDFVNKLINEYTNNNK